MRRVRYGGGHSWDEYEFEFEVPDNMSGYEIYCEVENRRDGFGTDDYYDWWATNPPVKATAWIDRGSNKGMKCSSCGCPIRYKNSIPNTSAYYNYCPKCGALMGVLFDYTCLSDKEWDVPIDKDGE